MAFKALFNEVEFLTQFPMLHIAISDSTSPVPGYLFGEINAITFVEHGNYCKPLVNFLVSRLDSEHPIVCIKVLKLLQYLVKNGHAQMMEEVKLHEVALKEARSFNGPPDPLHGISFYQDVRKMAKELLNIVYSEDKDVEKISLFEQTSFVGYGSDKSSTKMPGFGHSIKQEKTVSDVVSDSFSTFVEKLFPSPVKENAPQQMSHLSESLPQYKPIILGKSQSAGDNNTTSVQSSFKDLSTPVKIPKRKVKVHRPGRAGGGWESSSSDDNEDEISDSSVLELESCKDRIVSSESLENNETLVQCTAEVSDEQKVLEEFIINKPLYELKYSDITSICNRCSVLNREEILSLLLKKLSENEELVQLRALILIEYLLFHDVVSLDLLMKVVLPYFKEFLAKESDLKSPVKIKVKKIQANIEALHKNILQKVPLQEIAT